MNMTFTAPDVAAAIATPLGKGAVGIVRLSGADTLMVLNKIFFPKNPKVRQRSHQMVYGHIIHNSQVVDEVLCCYMRGPHSYTGEDTAEIYAHGGLVTLRAVLCAALDSGARPAEPGEFTRRAFLNGRMDLAQAEAVASLINAKTDSARSAGLRQLSGALSERINDFREIILTCLAHIELSIDYPEHESEAMNLRSVQISCTALIKGISELLATYRWGRVLTEGVRTAIVGRPNTGKSSLMNAILKEDRAIVTEIPGTTRDVLSEPVNVNGVPLLLLDTAGIRETEDIIEKIGVDRSIAQAESADLILLAADHSLPPGAEDIELASRFIGKNIIVLLNKSDLPPDDGWRKVSFQGFSDEDIIPVSAKEEKGLEDLYRLIKEKFTRGVGMDAAEADVITHERHRYLLDRALTHLRNAAAADLPEDIVSIDLRQAYYALGEILGEKVGDDVVERIFSEFCVGK